MKAVTKEAVEAGAIVFALLAVAWLLLRPNSTVSEAQATEDNIPIDHFGASGAEYYNYNYPAVQGLPFSLSPDTAGSSTTGCQSPTCACMENQLLGSNAEFQQYLQARLTGFVDQYAESVLSTVPSWFRQYLYLTGPGLSHLPAVEI